MKTNIAQIVGFLLVLTCILKVTYAANCTSQIQNAINYLTTSDPGYSRSVSFYMTSLKHPDIYAGFSVGSFQVKTYKILNYVYKYLYAKDFTTTFSDRTWCPNPPPGLFLCLGYQAFDYRRSDRAQLYLYTGSTATIVFTAWNSATYSWTLSCTGSFMYGIANSINTMFVIDLKYNRYMIPR